MPVTPKVTKPPVPNVQKTVRIISQPPNSGLPTGGFFAALTPVAQALALRNPALLATRQQTAEHDRRWGYAPGWYNWTSPYVSPLAVPGTESLVAAHEQAHALFYEWPTRPNVRPLTGLVSSNDSPEETFAILLGWLAQNPGAIAGRLPTGGFRQVFEPFVNRAYLWPYRPGPRVTGSY